jgi:hypothetical protein
MNRDDVIERPESGPRLWSKHGSTFAAPIDLQAGGVWIGVNAHGVIACLLNRYDAGAPVGVSSRGAVVVDAMRASAATEALKRLQALDHLLYSPFTCIVLSLTAGVRFDWDGAHAQAAALDEASPWMTTSSSWALDEVRKRRQALFAATWSQPGDPDSKISAFHCRSVEGGDAWAPMMKRESSQTKSVTQVEVGSGRATMKYWRRERALAQGLSDAETALSFDLHCRTEGAR